jgi:C4-dicarboxylate-specific signal transduction histidine kinase
MIAAAVHPDDVTEFRDTLGGCLATGAPFALRYRLRRVDGVYRWMSSRATPLRDEAGRIVQWYGLCHDIDDQIHAEEQLRLAQENLARQSRAASLAELSASIAHEVNQPLAAVVANSDAAQRWLVADPPNIDRAQKAVDRITRDANAAAEVVNRVRALFKQSAEKREAASLDSVVAEAVDLLAEEASRRGVRVDLDVEGSLPLVTLDRVQIQQVAVNLVRNGMEAMDFISTDRALVVRLRRVGGVVQTEISDRGPGIAFPDRIFEPFFTTKGQGMGMGLAISRSIVESHGGCWNRWRTFWSPAATRRGPSPRRDRCSNEGSQNWTS